MPHDFPKKRHRYHLLISIWQIRGFSSCRQVSSAPAPPGHGICLCWVWSNDCSFFSETVSVRVCHQEVSSECCQSIRSTMLLPRHRCIVVCPEGESCSCTWRPSTPSPWSDSPPAMPWAATGLNILTVSWFAFFFQTIYLSNFSSLDAMLCLYISLSSSPRKDMSITSLLTRYKKYLLMQCENSIDNQWVANFKPK